MHLYFRSLLRGNNTNHYEQLFTRDGLESFASKDADHQCIFTLDLCYEATIRITTSSYLLEMVENHLLLKTLITNASLLNNPCPPLFFCHSY